MRKIGIIIPFALTIIALSGCSNAEKDKDITVMLDEYRDSMKESSICESAENESITELTTEPIEELTSEEDTTQRSEEDKSSEEMIDDTTLEDNETASIKKEETTIHLSEKESKEETTTRLSVKESQEETTVHNHVYKQTIVEPTCTKNGYTLYTCSCGDSYKDNETPKKEHSYTATKTVPTCSTDGYTTYMCTCGDSYKSDIIYASHSWVEATCSSPKTCKACGITEGEALGHSYSDYVCTKCGAEDEEGIAINPLLSLQRKKRYIKYTQRENNLSEDYFVFNEDSNRVMFYSIAYSACESEAIINSYKVRYNGILYYEVGGMGLDMTYELTDYEVLVYYGDCLYYRFVLDVDGGLIVTYSKRISLAVGDKLLIQ